MTARTSYSRWYLWACVCVWIGGILPEQGCLQVSLTKNIQIQTLPVVLGVPELLMEFKHEANHATYAAAGGEDWVQPAQQNCAH